MKSTFEKIGGTYTLGVDGIYYPNLVSTEEELAHLPHKIRPNVIQITKYPVVETQHVLRLYSFITYIRVKSQP